MTSQSKFAILMRSEYSLMITRIDIHGQNRNTSGRYES